MTFSVLFLFVVGLATCILFFDDYFLTSAVMVQEDSRCGCSAAGTDLDILEHALLYTHGRFAGQCVNSCKYRYPEVLKVSEDKTTLLVSNVLHNNEFWIAQIPLESVKGVYILFEEFAPGINHVAFQFFFTDSVSVRLYSHKEKNSSGPRLLVNSLVVSPEAVLPKGNKYSLWDGFIGNYALMNRLMTYDAYAVMIKEVKHPLRRYRAKMKEFESKRLFTKVITDAPSVYHNQYQLFFNNCATTVIDSTLFAKDLLLSNKWDRWDFLDPLRGVPSHTLGTLRTLNWWQLIDESQVQASLPEDP